MACCYILKLYSPFGVLVAGNITDFISLAWARTENNAGSFDFMLPGHYADLGISRDYVFEIYDCSSGQAILDGETCWFVRKIEIRPEEGCGEVVVLSGHDTTGLLARRIVAWFSADSPPEGFNDPGYKTADALVALREIFDENFGLGVATAGAPISVTDPTESPEPLPAFTAQNRLMQAPTYPTIVIAPIPLSTPAPPIITQDIAWQQVLSVMQAIASVSTEQRLPIIFDIVYRHSDFGGLGEFEFRLWVKQRGITRDIVFAPEIGNLRDPALIKDWAEEVTWVHVGGPGTGALRLVAGVVDPVASHSSPFYPIEGFIDLNDESNNSQAALENAGRAELAAKRGKITVTGNVSQVPGSLFGVHYNYGDTVTSRYRGEQVLARISSYSVSVNDNSCEVTIPLSGETFIGQP